MIDLPIELEVVNFYVVFVYLALALIISFICSLLESVILSVTPSYVETKVEEKTWVGINLKRMKENIDEPLAAILTLNTISHTVGRSHVLEENYSFFDIFNTLCHYDNDANNDYVTKNI